MFAERSMLVACGMVVLAVSPTYSARTSPAVDARVRVAVRAAIEARIGQVVDVALDDFSCALTTDDPDDIVATPEPQGRIGRPLRFVIATAERGPRGHAVLVGEATATVRVSGSFVRAKRALLAGRTLSADDLEATAGSMEGLAFRRVPPLSELIGARLRRTLSAGEAIAASAVVLPPAVRAGDEIRIAVHHAGVEATTTAVAEQTAGIGQVIRVVNPGSRRALRARVVAAGEVEVVSEP